MEKPKKPRTTVPKVKKVKPVPRMEIIKQVVVMDFMN